MLRHAVEAPTEASRRSRPDSLSTHST